MDKCATLPITGYVIKANVIPENGNEAFDITSKFINDTRSDKGNFIVSFKDSFNEHLKPNAHYNFTVNGTDVKVSSTCPRK